MLLVLLVVEGGFPGPQASSTSVSAGARLHPALGSSSNSGERLLQDSPQELSSRSAGPTGGAALRILSRRSTPEIGESWTRGRIFQSTAPGAGVCRRGYSDRRSCAWVWAPGFCQWDSWGRSWGWTEPESGESLPETPPEHAEATPASPTPPPPQDRRVLDQGAGSPPRARPQHRLPGTQPGPERKLRGRESSTPEAPAGAPGPSNAISARIATQNRSHQRDVTPRPTPETPRGPLRRI